MAEPGDGVVSVENDPELTWERLDSRNAKMRNIRFGHSGLMLADLITCAHFSVSAAMILPKSAGEPANTAPPRSLIRVFILGSMSAALISLLSFSIISVG